MHYVFFKLLIVHDNRERNYPHQRLPSRGSYGISFHIWLFSIPPYLLPSLPFSSPPSVFFSAPVSREKNLSFPGQPRFVRSLPLSTDELLLFCSEFVIKFSSPISGQEGHYFSFQSGNTRSRPRAPTCPDCWQTSSLVLFVTQKKIEKKASFLDQVSVNQSHSNSRISGHESPELALITPCLATENCRSSGLLSADKFISPVVGRSNFSKLINSQFGETSDGIIVLVIMGVVMVVLSSGNIPHPFMAAALPFPSL